MIPVVVFCAALAHATAAASARSAEVIDRVMAVVDGTPITLSDVDAAIAFQLVTPPTQGDRLAGVLDRLIDRALMLAEVERYRPSPPAPEPVDARVAEIEQRAGSAAGLDRQLAAVGLSRDQLRRWVRDDLMIRAYLDERFGVSTPARGGLVRDWIASLRRRAEITTPYVVASGAIGESVNW
jgi:hypothetical protein